jgi:hypothetical protein
MAKRLESGRRRVMTMTESDDLDSRLSRARISKLELKVAWVITSLLDLSMARILISQFDLGMALIVGSKLARRTSGLAIRGDLVTCVSRHVCQGRSFCEDGSEEGRHRVKGGNE